jgi:hypothetical protein
LPHLVEALACLLPQALGLVEEGDELGDVDALREGVHKVLAHMEAHV